MGACSFLEKQRRQVARAVSNCAGRGTTNEQDGEPPCANIKTSFSLFYHLCNRRLDSAISFQFAYSLWKAQSPNSFFLYCSCLIPFSPTCQFSFLCLSIARIPTFIHTARLLKTFWAHPFLFIQVWLLYSSGELSPQRILHQEFRGTDNGFIEKISIFWSSTYRPLLPGPSELCIFIFIIPPIESLNFIQAISITPPLHTNIFMAHTSLALCILVSQKMNDCLLLSLWQSIPGDCKLKNFQGEGRQHIHDRVNDEVKQKAVTQSMAKLERADSM